MTQFASKSFSVPGGGVCYRRCLNRKVPYPHECEGCRVQGKRVDYAEISAEIKEGKDD